MFGSQFHRETGLSLVSRFHGTDLVGEVQSYREGCIRPKKTTAPNLIVIMVPPTPSKVALQLYT